MRIKLSDQTIDAIADVITGGSANNSRPPIGLYRAGWQIEEFMKSLDLTVDLGSHSRMPAVKAALVSIRDWSFDEDTATEKYRRVIERAADPRDFIEHPERHAAVIEHLNRYLAFDDLTIETRGTRVQLCQLTVAAPVVSTFAETLIALDFDTVQRDLDRALRSAQDDPEDAVTAACSVVESVCRTILVESHLELPARQDIASLYRAVREPLGLSPTKDGVPDLIADDVRNVLSGLVTAVQGIGALRTHGGDAHGRERGYRRIDTRIAKLSIHSASAVALFLIETWQLRPPSADKSTPLASMASVHIAGPK